MTSTNLLTVIIGKFRIPCLMRHQAGDPSFKEINEVHQKTHCAPPLWVGQLAGLSRASRTMQPKGAGAGREMVGELAQDAAPPPWREGIELKLENQPGPVAGACRRGAAFQCHHQSGWSMARDAMPGGRPPSASSPANREPSPVPAAPWAPPSCRPAIMCAIEVADTGVGISKETYEQDPTNPSSPPSRLGQGTGLGPRHRLWHRQADRAASSPWTAKWGRGTCFKIYLPRHRIDANAPSGGGERRRRRAAARRPTGQEHHLAGRGRRSGAQLRGPAPCACAAIMCWKQAAAREALEIVRRRQP